MKPDLYMVVGQDMVTFWLGQGWELYGSPTLDKYGWARQPMIKPPNSNVSKEGEDD